MYIVYNLLFTITINIENSYNHTNTARWPYRIIRLHKYTQVQYLSFGISVGIYSNIYLNICVNNYIRINRSYIELP